ncbi:hypothetical protein CpecS_0561 [Chlamydia pecorum VR629]|nr:hypothetical protein CpecS_0561 [Chlamydia pecorum VR629]
MSFLGQTLSILSTPQRGYLGPFFVKNIFNKNYVLRKIFADDFSEA